MKLISHILAILALASTAQMALAQARPAPGTTIIQSNDNTWVYVMPVCKFGMQFLVATQDKRGSGAASAGLVLIQVMAPVAPGSVTPTQPMACKDEMKSSDTKSQSR